MKRALTVSMALLLSALWQASMASGAVDTLIRGAEPARVVGASRSFGELVQEQGAGPLYDELHRAWRTLAQRVAEAAHGADTSLLAAPTVRQAYAALQARDRLYRHRLQRWAEHPDFPLAVRTGARAELAAYRQKTDPWHTLIAGWLASAGETDSLASFWYWATDFLAKNDLSALHGALDRADRHARRHPILGNAVLPHSQTRPAAPLHWPAAPITPVYARGTALEPADADLAAGVLAPLSDAVLAKAESLDHDPVRIFSYVQHRITTQWYAGAMKGADRTLAQGAGNDVDTATLLVALLRASSIPARYETGVVRIPAAFLETTLGIADPIRQRRFLQRNGRAVEPVNIDGRIAAFDLEYTWVAAYVPYANYRGAQVDKSGKVWLPLMPAAAARDALEPMDFLRKAGLGTMDPLAVYRQTDGATAPVQWLRERIGDALPREQRQALESRLGAPGPGPDSLDLLPASPPFQVRAVAEEGATVPERLIHRVRITLVAADGAVLMDKSLPLAQVDGQRLTVSYLSATREVQNAVNRFGGLYMTPAWLVSLRPQLRLNGRRVAVGEGTVAMGAFHDVNIELSSPLGKQTVNRAWVAGGYYALSLVAQQLGESVDYRARDVADTEHSGARLLSQLAARYNRRWLNDEALLAALTGFRTARPWPVLAIAANSYRRQYVLDRLQALQWQGVTLDAALHITEPVPAVDTPTMASEAWTRFSALQGSWREAGIVQRLFGVAAISADKGLRLASEQGIPVITAHQEADLAALSLPEHVIAAMREWLARGFVVTAPVREINHEDWHGAVWQVADPATGSSGYFISGGLAGGASSQQSWPVREYEDALRAINFEPQDETAPIGSIRKLGNADWQIGEPGQEGEPLIVQVLDIYGNPVNGVPVTFTVASGDARLATATATTNVYGVAEAGVTFGTSISAGMANWLRLEPGDRYASQVGVSLVEVTALDSEQGPVKARAPFHLMLRSGPASLEQSVLDYPDYGPSGLLMGNIQLSARDEYGNPVANASFSGRYSYQLWDGQNLADYQTGGLAVTGECQPPSVLCARPTASSVTDPHGVSLLQLIAANGGSDVSVALAIDGVDWRTIGFLTSGMVERFENPDIQIISTVHKTAEGDDSTATGVGQVMKEKKYVSMHWPQLEWGINAEGTIERYATLASLVPVEPADDLRFTADHASVTYQYLGDGDYELTITGGPAPGVGRLRMEGHVTFHAMAYWDETTRQYREQDVSLSVSGRELAGEVWVIKPSIESIASDHATASNSVILGPEFPDTTTAGITRVTTRIEPENYPGAINTLLLRQGQADVARRSFPEGGEALLESGIPVNAKQDYQLVYQVNGAIRSAPFPVPFYQPVLRSPRNGQRFVNRIQVDLASDWSCTQGGTIGFTLAHPATVTAEVGAQQVLDEETLAAGYHRLSYARTPGISRYQIQAQSSLDGHVESVRGELIVSLEYQPVAVGHTLVEGVNLFNGNLSLSHTDFELAGRGPGIALTRFYTLNNGGQVSPLGLGWSHSYNGFVQALGCGAYQVAGGLGGGGRFYQEGGELVPAQGRHGSLVRHDADNSFDYYTQDGTRYHYRHYPFDGDQRWHLEYIEDSNGNQVVLTYEQENQQPKLLKVQDDAGRTLAFSYGEAYAGENRTPLITAIDGPEGYRVEYQYDSAGRLTQVSTDNGGADRTQHYTYAEPAPSFGSLYEFLERGKLLSVTGALGNTTHYQYQRLPFSSLAGGVPNYAVRAISKETEQHGAIAMTFDYSDRTLPGEHTTQVDNFRGDSVHYQLDGAGRVLSQSLPSIQYQWYPQTSLLKSRTQRYQNGDRVTEYEYDLHGNVIKEKLNGHPVIERSYYPPDQFGGFIKNRLASVTDRNGNTTRYDYDANGNLVDIDYPEGFSESFNYADNGDRLGARDRDGHRISYSYDNNGYVVRARASQCCDVASTWNELGYRQSRTDGRGNKTTFETDQLGQVLAIHYPEGISESFDHDEAGNVTRYVNRNGVAVLRDYDEAGRMIAEIWPHEGSRTLEYDPHGNLIAATDFRGVRTVHDYDARDHRVRTRIVGADNTRVIDYDVDEQGNILREDRGQNRVTTWSYNDLNLPTRITDAEGHTTDREYDHAGNLISETDRRGHTTLYEYDGLNRRIAEQAPLERTRTWRYNGAGQVVRETDANGNITLRTWSQHGKLTSSRVMTPEQDLLTEQEHRYDPAGNVSESINSRGVVTRYTYDRLNRLIKKSLPQPLGPMLYTDHDGAGNVLREEWPNGNVIARQWDDHGRLLRETDNLGLRQARSYDANGNTLTETDARGTTITRTYTDFNQIKTERRPQHHEGDLLIRYQYDLLGNERFRRITDTLAGNGELVWETRYDLLDRPTHEIDPLGQARITAYDAEGNPVSVTNRRGKATTRIFDALNRVIEIHEPLGRTRLNAYDGHGNLIRETDPRGIVTRYVYDGLHRRVETHRDGVPVLTETFDGEGNRLTRRDAKGNTTTWEYNDADRVTQETGEEAVVTRYTYDRQGNRITRIDPENHLTRWTYDARQRVLSTTNSLSETTGFEYDGNGNRTARITPKGGRWAYTHTLAGLPETVTDPAGNITTYAYDGRGNRLSLTDGAGELTRWAYDVLGRVTLKTYPDGREHHYLDYDANGNLVLERDPEGQRIEHDYDALGRETARRYFLTEQTGDEGTPAVTERYVHDLNNNLTDVTETGARLAGPTTTHYVYDAFDRLTHQQDRFGQTVTYQYDTNGNRTRLISSAGHATEYRYDKRNRVADVITNGGENHYSYYRNGLLKGIRYVSGATAEYTYDAADRIKTINNRHHDALVSSYTYEYDANGNRTEQVESNGFGQERTTYAYDPADRLIAITYPEKMASYTYDGAWNRITETLTRVSDGALLSDKTLSYNPRHQLTEIDDSVAAINNATFTYDANGNQVEEVKNGVATAYTYDTREHLRKVTVGGSSVGQFLYDYRGLRTEKQSGQGSQRYSYDDQSVLFQTDAANQLTTRYEYGPHRLLSLKQPSLPSEFYLFDALDSPVTLIRKDGSITARYAYSAWGRKRHDSGTSVNRFGFTGHEHDTETGLIYAKARYYDPDTARFLSQDPWSGDATMPPSLNKYLYAYQNPTVYVDPDGRFPVLEGMTDELGRWREQVIDTADGLERNGLNVFPYFALTLSDSLLGALESGTGALNLAGDLALSPLASADSPSFFLRESARSLAETRQTVTDTIEIVVENPKAVGLAVIDAATRTMEGIAEGDPRATARMFQGVFDVALGGKIWVSATKMVKQTAGAGRRVGHSVRVRPVVADSTTSGTVTGAQWNEFLAVKYGADNVFWDWPKNKGFVYGADELGFLQSGWLVGRLGSERGTFVSPLGTAPETLSLRPGTDLSNLNVYRVLQETPNTRIGPSAPAFDMPGYGSQYELPKSVKELLESGYIERVTK